MKLVKCIIRRIRLFILDVRLERICQLLELCEKRQERLLARFKRLNDRYFRIKNK